ncbi:MAG: WG repeat-containing protein [Bacteroidota bacterium]
MKASILLFLIGLFVSTFSYCQKIEYRIIPFEEGGLWGYMNHKKEIIVAPKYEEAYPTYNSAARIKYKGKYGYIDKKGEIIIKTKYNEADDFRFGIARVQKGNQTFYIKGDGKKNREIVAVCGGGTRHCFQPFAHTEKKEVANEDEKYLLLPRGKNKFRIDTLSVLFDSIFQFNKALFLQINSKIAVIPSWGRNRLFRDEHKSKKPILDFKYEEIKLFRCKDKDGYDYIIGLREGNLWKYFDTTYLHAITKVKYLSIHIMQNNLALVEYQKGKFGYIDNQGNEYFYRE